MKIINAGYEIIKEPVLTKKIERIARICYKSEDKIGLGTDVTMLKNLVNKQHLAMLEHGDVCVEVSKNIYDLVERVIYAIESCLTVKNDNGTSVFMNKCFLRRTETYIIEEKRHRYIISGNIRAWYEFFTNAAQLDGLVGELFQIVNKEMKYIFSNLAIKQQFNDVDKDLWEVDLSNSFCKKIHDITMLSYPERMTHETITVLFTVDRGVTHELVRMRDSSFAQESTRYCNYSLGKFDKEITVIKPCFWDKDVEKYNMWKHSMQYAEVCYNNLIDIGATAQEARGVLPHSVKADLVITTNLIEWKHIFSLRACDSTGPAHPQVKEVMIPLLKEVRDGDYNFAFKDLLTASEV